jgi:hypothetical protein
VNLIEKSTFMLRSRSRQKGLDSCTRNHVDKRVRHEISADRRVSGLLMERPKEAAASFGNEAIGRGLFT